MFSCHPKSASTPCLASPCRPCLPCSLCPALLPQTSCQSSFSSTLLTISTSLSPVRPPPSLPPSLPPPSITSRQFQSRFLFLFSLSLCESLCDLYSPCTESRLRPRLCCLCHSFNPSFLCHSSSLTHHTILVPHLPYILAMSSFSPPYVSFPKPCRSPPSPFPNPAALHRHPSLTLPSFTVTLP